MSSCVPPATTILAGIDLAKLRSSPLYPKLPPSALALLDPLRDAKSLMLASDGRNLLTIARGKKLDLGGTPEFVAAATAQRKTGQPGAAGLVTYASTVAPGAQIWIVVPGGVRLPLAGNAANVNRLLRDTEYAAVTVKLTNSVEIDFDATGRTAEAARQVEDTLRAVITLAAAGEARKPDVVALLRAIQLTRDDRKVRASLAAPADGAQKLLDLLQ
jgi:hypothetical protein